MHIDALRSRQTASWPNQPIIAHTSLRSARLPSTQTTALTSDDLDTQMAPVQILL